MSSLPDPATDAVGYGKRLDFIAAELAASRPRRVLDMGCGTGLMLTAPLAALFPETSFVGVDDDGASIAWAADNLRATNLRFTGPQGLAADERFDLVIASEVLEHVREPAPFLAFLAGRVPPGGRLVITVPNGNGPSEILALAEVLAKLSGVQKLLGGLKRRLLGQAGGGGGNAGATLAISPHVQFFRRSDLEQLFAGAGLAIVAFRARTILCGWLLDSLIRLTRSGRLNAALADSLPACCASDWMYVLERSTAAPSPEREWRQGRLASWRRRMILLRWGING
ncbi:class I SAM-dependent methyltransferase [Magnetospirillum sp. 15-1]|uniref:class I SAM-dependent methyltransferase n=1 Tax=Magnetospirillum sp. 15-1 TaxID=1979370 RepID=UPI000BBB7F1D|nr:class I SAM-dependent methyltransferase [Magnetospirillum sp. 15-1]